MIAQAYGAEKRAFIKALCCPVHPADINHLCCGYCYHGSDFTPDADGYADSCNILDMAGFLCKDYFLGNYCYDVL